MQAHVKNRSKRDLVIIKEVWEDFKPDSVSR